MSQSLLNLESSGAFFSIMKFSIHVWDFFQCLNGFSTVWGVSLTQCAMKIIIELFSNSAYNQKKYAENFLHYRQLFIKGSIVIGSKSSL